MQIFTAEELVYDRRQRQFVVWIRRSLQALCYRHTFIK